MRPRDAKIILKDHELALPGSRGFVNEHLERLRALPAHGNRTLHIDQAFLGLLLAFFEPLVRSLRTIESCGDFGGRLDLQRLARSTMSDAMRVFDPAHLKPVIHDLQARVPHLASTDADLHEIARRIIAADGTYLTTLVNTTWALRHTKSNGKGQGQVRVNVQMDVATWTPQVVTVSGDDGESEAAAFARDLLSDVLYVIDRNFLEFSFLNQLLEKDNDFVLRIRANAPATQVILARPLTPADVEAGVIRDEIVLLTGRDAPVGEFRQVTIISTNRHGEAETIGLLTNLMNEAAAHVIGAIYRQRWQIELFFKWFKTWARMDHLLSASRNGITFQLYVAVIAVLMIYVQTGRRVSIYALVALNQMAHGQMTFEQVMAVINRRERERELERARQARRRAQKKLA